MTIRQARLNGWRRYEDLGQAASGGRKRSRLAVDAHLFGEHDVLSARSDLLDCQVNIPLLNSRQRRSPQ